MYHTHSVDKLGLSNTLARQCHYCRAPPPVCLPSVYLQMAQTWILYDGRWYSIASFLGLLHFPVLDRFQCAASDQKLEVHAASNHKLEE